LKEVLITPIQKILISFLLLILLGSGLLMLPFSTVKGISYIDALFTSTSAVCVTGLITVDTSTIFTFTGQMIILGLIQLGGLGIMTFSLSLFSLAGGNLSLKWRYAFENIYNDIHSKPVKSILKRIVLYTLTIESTAAVLLYTQFIQKFEPGTALKHAVFHSISAFCNAGFSTFTDNLMGYYNNTVVIMTVACSIILGGLGFLVLQEVAQFIAFRKKRKTRRKALTLHTRFVLVLTIIAIAGGMLSFGLLEWRHMLSTQQVHEKILTSFFQSVTCRTAGFNTVDIGSLRQSTLFIMLMLMFVGGSPGSIAGGIKTTTAGVICLLIYSKFRGEKQIRLGKRALDPEIIERSMTLMILAMSFIFLSTFLTLTIHEFDLNNSFLSAFFEITSAFGTVGLSMGVTNHLSAYGKLLISLVMLVGRLGPLTLILGLTSKHRDVSIEYPVEQIMIG